MGTSRTTATLEDLDGLSKLSSDSALHFSVNKLDWLITASQAEAQAEITRSVGASGILGTRQYVQDTPFSTTDKVKDVGFSMLGIHEHSHYIGTMGFAEVSAIVNGLYVRTRHNDYKLVRTADATAAYLATVPNPTPPVPASVLAKATGVAADGTVDVVGDTQAKYMKEVVTANPQDCVWEMGYMEVWLEEFSSELIDGFSSFRHTLASNTIEAALQEAITLNQSGSKEQSENDAFLPSMIRTVDANGLPVIGTVKYRILSFPVATGAELSYDAVAGIAGSFTGNDFVMDKDIRTRKARGFASWSELEQSRFCKFDMDPVVLDGLIQKIPGLDGLGASLTEEYDNNGTTEALGQPGGGTLNSAYYNHEYSKSSNDAVGRNREHRGFNDPNMYVAKTTHPEVIGGFTYMVPMEMILRTPLESWNPHGLADIGATAAKAETASGLGVDSGNPYTGYAEDSTYYLTPINLFGADVAGDPADTGKGGVWIKDSGDVAQHVEASGMRVVGQDGSRFRFPVAPVYEEFTKGWVDQQALREEVVNVLKGIVDGSITSATQIDALL